MRSEDQSELARLRAERDSLKAELARQNQKKTKGGGTLRRSVVVLLVVVSCLLAVVGIAGVWAYRTTFDTDKWVDRVAPIVEHRPVTDALSRRLTEQIFVLIDVQGLTAQALPPQAAPLAGPLTSAVRDSVEERVEEVLASEEFRRVWVEANRFAHQQILAVLRNESEIVDTTEGTVTLNLLPVMNAVLERLEATSSGLFGREVSLPEISSGEVPEAARQRIEAALGIDLPEDFGEIPVYRSDRLDAAQTTMASLDRSVLWLVILTPLGWIAALWISRSRRRTLIQLMTGTLVGVVVVRRLVMRVQEDIVDLAREENRGAARVAVEEVLSSFFSNTQTILIIGLIVIALALATGPYEWAVSLRRKTRELAVGISSAIGTRAHDEATAIWIRGHRDALQLGGAIFAVLVLLFVDLSWIAFLMVIALVGVYELIVVRIGQDAPPDLGEAEGVSSG